MKSRLIFTTLAAHAIAVLVIAWPTTAIAARDPTPNEQAGILQALGADDADCWSIQVADHDATWAYAYEYATHDCSGTIGGPDYTLRLTDRYWNVRDELEPRDLDQHGGQCPFAGIPTPIALEFFICESPVPCRRSKPTVGWVEDDLIDTYARSAYPKYYGGRYAPTGWGLTELSCVDLTGDGHLEMVAKFGCCTGGALTPWGIYKRDSKGRWARAYAQVLRTAYPVTVHRRSRTIVAHEYYRYEGAFTHWFQDRVVLWHHGRFRSHLGHPYDICKRTACQSG